VAEGRPGGSEPVYLTLDDVLNLHGLIIGASSTQAADQLRNRGGLESALARPAAYAHYEDADLAHQAAALAHAIAEGQQFIDGNKRTALVAMLTFLEINGLRVEASDYELADWILSFSAGAKPEQVAALLRTRAHRIR
jgi:death-on-curing protein